MSSGYTSEIESVSEIGSASKIENRELLDVDVITESEEDLTKKFEGFLAEVWSAESIRKCEKQYIKGSDNEIIMEQMQFDYAMSLIGSRFGQDIHRGIVLMEGLTNASPVEKVQSWLIMSYGYARMNQFTNALRFLAVYRQQVPKSARLDAWKNFLEAKKKQHEAKEWDKKVMNFIMTTSAVVTVGTVVGFCFMVLKLS